MKDEAERRTSTGRENSTPLRLLAALAAPQKLWLPCCFYSEEAAAVQTGSMLLEANSLFTVNEDRTVVVFVLHQPDLFEP